MSAAYTNLKQQLHDYVYNRIPLNNLTEHLQNVSRAEIYELTESVRSSRGCTVLHYAAYINDLDTTESILDSFAPTERCELLRIQDESGVTPIHLAALTGHTKSVRYMLDSVVSGEIFSLMQIQDGGKNTAIHYAVLKGNTDTAVQMLATIAPDEIFELMVITGGFGRTAIHEAALNDYTETIKCILELVSPENRLELLYVYVGDVRTTLDRVCNNRETAEFIRQYWRATRGSSLEICALQAELRNKEQTIQRQEDVITDMGIQKEADDGKIHDLGGQLVDKDVKIAELTAEREIAVAATRELESELQKKDDLLQQKDGQITDLTAEVIKSEGQMDAQVDPNRQRSSELEQDLQEKADKQICAALQVELRNKERNIQKQKHIITDMSKQIAANDKKIHDLEGQLVQKSRKIEELMAENEVEVAARRELEGKLQEKDDLLKKKDVQITAQVVKSDAQHEELRQMEARVTQLEEDMQGKADKKQCTEIAEDQLCHPKQEANHEQDSDG